MATGKPAERPRNSRFSSGPCAKIPGWSPELLAGALIGRSHRSKAGKARLRRAIELTREVLEIPDSHLLAIVPASDTGAVEIALWSLLGERPVDLLAFESFGAGWVNDVVKQLGLKEARVFTAPYGRLPELGQVDFSHDVVFTWNGTTSGVRVPDGSWIARDRSGLSICDATSAAFAQRLAFDKLDVTTLSWQKALGGEAAHGMLVLSPRAVERLETYRPPWPLPKIFRLTQNGKLNRALFEGETINTPSMLCVEDWIVALEWAKRIGGLAALVARADGNAALIHDWADRSEWIEVLAADRTIRSNTSVCLRLRDEREAGRAADIVKLLEAEGIALDIGSHRDAPPGLRVWCGATVERIDVAALIPWLDYAYRTIVSEGSTRS